jgi:DNA-directed RNA polymerase specialized sigma24 family protein
MPDDAELLGCYASDQSEDAFAELVRRHLPFVYAAALRQVGGDDSLAQDVAQIVFSDLARKRVGAHPPPRIGGLAFHQHALRGRKNCSW